MEVRKQWNNEAFHDAWKCLNKAAKAKTAAERDAEERVASAHFWRACGMDWMTGVEVGRVDPADLPSDDSRGGLERQQW